MHLDGNGGIIQHVINGYGGQTDSILLPDGKPAHGQAYYCGGDAKSDEVINSGQPTEKDEI